MTGGYPMTAIDVTCHNCGTNHQIMAPVASVLAWQEGEYIQDALPTLSAGERELLISRTCDDCWTEMFGNCEE